jgi:hypothetical protein
MTRTSFIPLLALAALLPAAAPALAQGGNQSDVTGPNITGAGAAGGSYQGAGVNTENEMFAGAGSQTVFRTARIGCAVRDAGRAFRDSVAAAALSASETRAHTLLGSLQGSPRADEVAAILAHGADPASPMGQAARDLARALTNLLRDAGACAERREAFSEAPQWREAIRAFNEYVRRAPDSALSPPAPELVAIHQALQRVVEAALRDPHAR